jgi:hypothetical protein
LYLDALWLAAGRADEDRLIAGQKIMLDAILWFKSRLCIKIILGQPIEESSLKGNDEEVESIR